MTERLALLAQLEAKPGMGQRLAAVLESAQSDRQPVEIIAVK